MRFVLYVSLLLICFSCEDYNLPEIHINCEQEINSNTKSSCAFKLKDGISTIETLCTVKYRGGFSSGFQKKSYAIELAEKHSLCGMKKDDDWILNANYIDKTFMRHKISYDIFREMNNSNVAAQSCYINVFENNNYQGLYVLMEKINAGMLQLDKKDSLACLFKDPPIFLKESINLHGDNPFQQKYPHHKTSGTIPIIESFRSFLFESSDEDFLQDISSWIEIENVIDWHLLLLLSNNSDGILKNFYLYKRDSNTPFRVAIWDYDHSFGRDGDNELNMLSNILDCNRSILFYRLTSIPQSTYLQQLKNRYSNLRETSIFSYGNIDKHWKNNFEIIKNALKQNERKWNYDGEYYYDDNNFQAEKTLFFEFLEMRLKQLDTQFGYTS